MSILLEVYGLALIKQAAKTEEKKTYPISRAITNQTAATAAPALSGALRAGLNLESNLAGMLRRPSNPERAVAMGAGALVSGAMGAGYNALRRMMVAQGEKPGATTLDKVMKWINPLDAVIYSRALKGRRALGTEWESEKAKK